MLLFAEKNREKKKKIEGKKRRGHLSCHNLNIIDKFISLIILYVTMTCYFYFIFFIVIFLEYIDIKISLEYTNEAIFCWYFYLYFPILSVNIYSSSFSYVNVVNFEVYYAWRKGRRNRAWWKGRKTIYTWQHKFPWFSTRIPLIQLWKMTAESIKRIYQERDLGILILSGPFCEHMLRKFL